MNGIPISLPRTPRTLTELQHLRNLRHSLLIADLKYPQKGVYKPMGKYNRDKKIMRLINVRLYELTGNDMYIWLGGDYNKLKKIEHGQN